MVDARLESRVDEHDRMLIEMQTILKGMAESQTKMADGIVEKEKALEYKTVEKYTETEIVNDESKPMSV